MKEVSNWKKVLRIVVIHDFRNVKVRGLTAQEVAIILLRRRKQHLNKEEILFLESILK
jgi:hypothetical protein